MVASNNGTQKLPLLKETMAWDKVSVMNATSTVYLELIPDRPDSKDTIMMALTQIEEIFVKKLKYKHVMVCGDGKTVNVLHAIKDEYHFSWLLVMLGSWHLIKDYLKIFLAKYKIAIFEPVFKELFSQGSLEGIFRVAQWGKTHLLTTLVMESLRRILLESFEKNQMQQESGSELLLKLRESAQVNIYIF